MLFSAIGLVDEGIPKVQCFYSAGLVGWADVVEAVFCKGFTVLSL